MSEAIFWRFLKIPLIVVAAWLAQRTSAVLIKQLRRRIKKSDKETRSHREKRIKTITSLLINTSRFVINIIALLLILAELGVNIFPLITGVGILGLAIGMGAKNLVADFIAGFFILLENQFDVGDWIQVSSSVEGRVAKIGLRTITLKDKEGRVHIVPNSALKIITKKNKG